MSIVTVVTVPPGATNITITYRLNAQGRVIECFVDKQRMVYDSVTNGWVASTQVHRISTLEETASPPIANPFTLPNRAVFPLRVKRGSKGKPLRW